jgi:hypothetical protein
MRSALASVRWQPGRDLLCDCGCAGGESLPWLVQANFDACMANHMASRKLEASMLSCQYWQHTARSCCQKSRTLERLFAGERRGHF